MLKSLAMFFFRLLIANLLILLYPVLAVLVPLLAITYGDRNSIHLTAAVYTLLGPLPAGFWFLFAHHYPMFREAKKRGETLNTWNLEFHVGATLIMIGGIVMSYGATLTTASQITSVESPLAWFALICLAQNSPTLLMLAWRSARGPRCVCNGEKCFMPGCYGTIRRGFCAECHGDYTVVA